jgi:hypothetical protein
MSEMDDPMYRDPGDEAVRELLAAYVDRHLRPDPARMGRIRQELVQQAGPRPAGRPAQPVPAPRPRVFGILGRRPVAALLGAAMAILVLTGAAFATSRAGGPLYGTRLWLEELTIPSEPSAREGADLDRLERRLAEASDAAAQGNGAAVTAALDAYRQEVDDALTAAGSDVDRLTRLRLEITLHQIVLETLVGRLPGPAADAVNRVLDQGLHALDTIRQKGGGKPSVTPAAAGGGGNGGGGGGGAQPTNAPDKGGKPTARPDHTPAGNPPTDRPTHP